QADDGYSHGANLPFRRTRRSPPTPREAAMTDRTEPVPAAATWGLFAAWALHDAEELITMPGWAERARPRLERALSQVPGKVWDGRSVDRAHTRAAIGLMGCVVLAASAEGARTGGRSPLYQAVLAGFGLHTLTHLASAAVLRGYTPGVVTARVVAAPFTLWARHRLRRAGVPTASGRSGAAASALFPVVVGGVHAGPAGLVALGRAVRGRRRRPA